MSGAWGGDWKNKRSQQAEAANNHAMRTPTRRFAAPAFKDANERALNVLRGLVSYTRRMDNNTLILQISVAEMILALAEVGYKETYKEEK